VELAPKAGVDDSLFQTYIGTGSEPSSFPDCICPKLVGTQLQRDELAFGRAEENGNYLVSTWRLLTVRLEGCASFMTTKESNLNARERRQY
jgi:hypothetical protein